MELKTKYQYTYFIKPFSIKEDKYEDYLLKLLKDKNCALRIFEKEKDMEIYSYFLQNVKDYYLPTFSYDKEKVKKINSLDNKLKAGILSKLHCNIFEYDLSKQIQGKISEENGIFFNINKIEIICFDTGICFLSIKTIIENSENFCDVLDFNYKFKDINSDISKLKEYNNIKIQTSKFENMKEISSFIQSIIGLNKYSELKNIDMYNQRFFVYAYCCIDQKDWNSEEDFNKIENEFLKFSNILSHNNNYNFNKEDNTMQSISKWKYAKFGFSKQCASLLTSNIDINNYTKLLHKYENENLYTVIINLYQRILLKKMSLELKNKKDIDITRKRFTKFTKQIWLKEITNSDTGSFIYSNWRKVFQLDEIYTEIKNKYDVIYKESSIEKNSKINKIMGIILALSLVSNIVSIIALLKNI